MCSYFGLFFWDFRSILYFSYFFTHCCLSRKLNKWNLVTNLDLQGTQAWDSRLMINAGIQCEFIQNFFSIISVMVRTPIRIICTILQLLQSARSLFFGKSLEIRVMKIMNEINWGHVRIAHYLYIPPRIGRKISQKFKS